MQDWHDLSPSSSEFEILCLQLLSCDRPTYVFLCYRPPHQDVHAFTNQLRHLTSLITEKSAHIILIGDFNARLSQWSASDPNTREGWAMQNCFDDLSMSQLVLNHPTWYSPCGGNSLDLVASNLPDQIVDLRILPNISDHSPVMFGLQTRRITSNTSTTELHWNFSKTKWQELREYLWSLPLLDSCSLLT